MQKNHRGIIETLLLLACAVWIVSRCEERVPVFKERRDTVTVVKSDTIIQRDTIRAPKPDTAYVVKYVRIPVRDRDEKNDTTTMTNQPDSMALPITQKVYSDSTYTAWVSGYMPQLDSIALHKRYVFRTITNTITVTKNAPKWTVGLTSGAGIGILHRQPDVFIGVGVSYRLWPP